MIYIYDINISSKCIGSFLGQQLIIIVCNRMNKTIYEFKQQANNFPQNHTNYILYYCSLFNYLCDLRLSLNH